MPMRAARKFPSGTCFAGLRKQASEKLAAAGIESAELDARVLLSIAAGMEAAELVSLAAQEVPERVASKFEMLIERRLKGEPVARILGKKEFWSHEFLLGPGTLVPRSDSETVVEAALAAKTDRNAELFVLDLGAGTGILLAAILLERPKARGIAVDRSFDALQVARENFRRLALTDRASCICGDWGAGIGRKFDLVVANPPYVETSVIAGLDREVREHDPALALDGGPDGLDAYRAICADLGRLLLPDGIGVFELGMGQEAAVSGVAHRAGLTVNDLRMDLAGRPRALVMGIERDKKALGSFREPH